jgi:hypothetical protein
MLSLWDSASLGRKTGSTFLHDALARCRPALDPSFPKGFLPKAAPAFAPLDRARRRVLRFRFVLLVKTMKNEI